MSWDKLLVGIGFLAGLSVLAALLWPRLKHRAIYPGGVLTEAMSHPSMHGLPDAEEVWLETEDGVRIHAWWTPAREAAGGRVDSGRADSGRVDSGRVDSGRVDPSRVSSRGAGPVGDAGPVRGAVLYSHGNAETMATRAWIAHRLSRRGFDVLMFDYRGYGLSEGSASEEGIARDARAAWRHVVEERGVAPDRIILMGHSLGSAVAARLALEVQHGEVGADGVETDAGIAALVVGSPFPDMPTLFAHHGPWLPGFALRWKTERLDAGSRLGAVTAPVLVLIATEDDVIPPAISRRVVEATGGVQVVTAPTDHASLMAHDRVWRALEAFLPGGN